jgi:hypothetical protein
MSASTPPSHATSKLEVVQTADEFLEMANPERTGAVEVKGNGRNPKWYSSSCHIRLRNIAL